MDFNIAVMSGDYIGPEVTYEAVKVLEAVGKKFNHRFHFKEVYGGGAAIDKYGDPLPEDSIEICKSAQAVLLGAVGGPKWDHVPAEKRPEAGLLRLRETLGLFANLRPAYLYKQLESACPIKAEFVKDGIDILVVRELTGGIYFGQKGQRQGEFGLEAYDEERYSEFEIKRIARVAFEAAQKRKKNIVSVDKANVLESSRLWRKTMESVKEEYKDVALSHMYVDNASMQLVRNPGGFDVLVTSNMFGDILSDEASMITGSIGMLPSASMNETSFGLYEPIHGSAPDIAGLDMANPIAAILSAAMMFTHSFGLAEEATAIEEAVAKALSENVRTPDIYAEGMKKVTTKEMGNIIAGYI